MHTIATGLTLQGGRLLGDAGQRVAGRELLSAVYDRCATERELSGGICSVAWERDLGSGSNLQLQTYYDRTNRNRPTLPSLEIRLISISSIICFCRGGRTSCGASERA